jgi:hypothetical protein
MPNTDNFDFHKILREIRHDVTRRAAEKSRVYGGQPRDPSNASPTRGSDGSHGGRPVLPIAPRNAPILTRLEPTSNSRATGNSARDVSIAALLKLEDAEFIEAAYLRLLNRLPDEGGRNTYLGLLRAGMPKIQILGAMWQSDEARTVGTRFAGLHRRLLLYRISKIPLLGLIITPLIEVIQSASYRKQQRATIGRIYSDIEIVRRESQQAFSGVEGSMSEFGNCISDIIGYVSVCASRQEIAELRGLLDDINGTVAALRGDVEDSVTPSEVAAKLDALAMSFQAFQDYVAQRLDALNSKLYEENSRLRKRSSKLRDEDSKI